MRKQWTNMDDLLAEAVEISQAPAREAFIRRVCAGDQEQFAELQSLVNDYFAAESLLDHPAVLMATVDYPVAQDANQQIGPYKVRELLGEGGMGSVYVAEQTQPVRRKVALKIIKPGMDSRQVISRFEAERQALALMDHPNIARVLDAGTTTTGRPYFVMELVKGVPITEFCDSHQLGTRERLELFIQVCQAVQHAHQKGIIHRDLKPSNILVTLHDTTPVVKVIDFGVAKAIGQQLTENTLYTGFSQMLGTPLYMSPEQAGQSGLDIDTRSDIYTLGVLLYELLTGSTPFTSETMKQAGFDEMRRIIREVDPPRPSARVSTLQLETLSTISLQRKMEPQHLKRQLRGELDWIVMKAIEKDRNRRYESASGLAMEIRRYLNDEPVLAGPPSSTYRLGKFARRNRGLLVTLSLVGLAIVAGGLTAAWQAWEAGQARNDARQKEQLAETNFQKALDAVDQMLTRLANQKLRNIPQMEELSREILNEALKFYEEFKSQRIADPAVLQRIGSARRVLALIQMQMGQGKAAEESTRVALGIFEDLHERFPERQDYTVELAETYDCMGWHTALGDASKMAGYHRQAISILEPIVNRQLAEGMPTALGLRSRLGKSYQSLGARLNNLNNLNEAETALRRAISLCEGDLENGQRIAALAHFELAEIFEKKERFEKALDEVEIPIAHGEKMLEKTPNDQFVLQELAQALETRGRLLVRVGKKEGAEASFNRTLVLLTDLAEKYPSLIGYQDHLKNVLKNLESHYKDMGNLEKSVEMARQRGVLKERILARLQTAVDSSPNDFNALELLFRYRWSHSGNDKKKCFEPAKKMTEIQPENPVGWLYLGQCLVESKKWEEGIQALNKVLELTGNPSGEVFFYRGVAYLATRRFSLARQDLERGIQLTEDRWWRRKRLAEACFNLADYSEALRQLTLAFQENPKDLSIINWIPPETIAACPDESFKKAMVDLAGKAVEFHKGSSQSLQVRAQLSASLGQADLALRDFDAAVTKGQMDCFPCYQHALLACNRGDQAKYRSVCEQMLRRFGDSNDLKERHFAIWTCLLMPDTLPDYSALEKIALRNLEDNEDKKTALNALGGVLLRAGKLEEALIVLVQSENCPLFSGNSGYGKYFLAMVYQGLGQADSARVWLAKARQEIQSGQSDSWNRKLTRDLLDREISGRLP